MIVRKLLLVLLIFGAFLSAGHGFAAEQPGCGVPGAQTDATALLARMGDFLSKAKEFSVSIKSGYDVLQETGQKIEFGESRKVTMVRPDRIRVDVERSDGEKALVLFDGQDITVFSPKEKFFAKASQPGDVDNAIRYLLTDLKLRLPLAMMFTTRLPSEIERRVVSSDLVEETTLMDIPCAHLAVRTEQVDFQIWIPSTGDPLPRRVIITYKNEPGQPQFWANLDWSLSPNPPDGFFAFSPPEGVQRIPFLSEVQVAKPDVQKVKKGGKK